MRNSKGQFLKGFSSKPSTVVDGYKICTKCCVSKSITEFGKSTDTRECLRSRCKKCHCEDNLKYKNLPSRKVWLKNYMKKYRTINRKKLTRQVGEYHKNKASFDINFKISINLRKRIGTAIKNNFKSGSSVKDLGCSIEFLKVYIESLFTEGMNWNNWSKTGWHLDHIIPLASFDLSNREQFLKAVHYSNLQPLWAKDNLRKGKFL